MSAFRTLAALLVLLTACSDPADREAQAVPQHSSLLLVFDTSAGTDVELGGSLAAVALEGEDGRLTPNLTPDRPAVNVTHPLGRSSGVELSKVPHGTYVALHLLFEDLGAVMPDGQVLPAEAWLPSTRIQFGAPLTLPGGLSRFVLRHRNPLTLEPVSGEVFWGPDLEARSIEFHPLFDLSAEVHFTDPESRTATVTVPAWGDAVVRLEFDESVSLRLGDRPVSTADFARILQPGTVLRVDGVAWDAESISVLSAGDEAPPPAPGPDLVAVGGSSRVTGMITRLAGPDRFELSVRGVHNAGDGFPAESPLLLLVHVDGGTSIEWTPSRRPRSGPVGFDALTSRMLVDVQWDGSPVDRIVTASAIGIRAADRSRLRSAWSGDIEAVDLTAGTISFRGRRERGSPMVWPPGGGFIQPPLFFSTFTIDLLPDSVIVRQALNHLFMPVEMEDRLVGQGTIVLVDHLDSRNRAVLVITP